MKERLTELNEQNAKLKSELNQIQISFDNDKGKAD